MKSIIICSTFFYTNLPVTVYGFILYLYFVSIINNFSFILYLEGITYFRKLNIMKKQSVQAKLMIIFNQNHILDHIKVQSTYLSGVVSSYHFSSLQSLLSIMRLGLYLEFTKHLLCSTLLTSNLGKLCFSGKISVGDQLWQKHHIPR